ncbi:PLP-dependent aminotransferase family protein [Bradyrhizobium sp. ARR65]|uniref:MocR-like pyridoxine biosynthesis transcription factor PdxR n=1 Tax=Bradyrhizobium sp. ARR65 TaxID=1040989 RepID=UPI0009FBFAB0|nr:PLP-dependent aminotransferase family protein [Bradyrhizobium sp. ARR65]
MAYSPPPLMLAGGKTPIHRQIYDHFRSAITTGQLRPGDRLPSARSLAQQLSVARGTVDTAYAMLTGEGYVVSRRALGTIVSPHLPSLAARRAATERRDAPLPLQPAQREPRPFQLGLPALDAFPRKLWSRLVAREARALSAADMAYPDGAGYWPLREAIAAYLAVGRGAICSARQVVITSGYQGALGLIIRALLKPKDKVWFEDPCYHLARAAFEAAGTRIIPVPVDAEGMRVSEGIARAPDARLAVVTPSHQSPLGVALSLPRRLSLLSWAAEARAIIVEDDYDGEFHYAGRPLPALKSLDRGGCVIYAGSLSKVLFPGLRLGYLVLPDDLADAFERTIRNSDARIATFEQRVVAGFMTEGHFARHLKRMRSLYAERRQALADALKNVFGDRVIVDLQPGGMHLIARFASLRRDSELASKAEAAGFAVEPLSRRAIRPGCGDGLLLGFTNVAGQDAQRLCRRLANAIGETLRAGA